MILCDKAGCQTTIGCKCAVLAHQAGYRLGFADALIRAAEIVENQKGMQGWKRRIGSTLRALAREQTPEL